METFEAGWREHYDWRARQYANEAEAAAYSDRGLAVRMQTLTGLLQRLPLPAAPATLDIGCATGAYARALRSLGHRVVGVDYAFSALARARSADVRTPYLAGDAYALPFADAAFDAVVCMGVLQLVARAYDLLAEASRVLRPGGVLVVEMLNGASLAVRALRVRDRLRRHVLSHALHRPAAVRAWLRQTGFDAVHTQGLYRFVGHSTLRAALDRHDAVGDRLAEAMFFVGRKAVGRNTTGSREASPSSRHAR
jgi:SAM-dependent methyltransferase